MEGKLDVSRREFLKRTPTTAALVAGSLRAYVKMGCTPLALEATVRAHVRP